MKIVTADQMRRIDEACGNAGLPTSVLMENAGKAVAEQTREILGEIHRNILVLTGPGNNGGDGLVAARYLHEWGASVTVYICTKRPDNDENLKLVQERNVPCVEASLDEKQEKLSQLVALADVVVDAMLGTGKARPLHGIYPRVIEQVNDARSKRPNLCVIAVDLPTGLNADTGEVDSACINADYTITLAFPKVGLYSLPGAEKAGTIITVDIGIPPHLAGVVNTELITADEIRAMLPARPPGANKGTFGRVLVVAGSLNYVGAAYLACTGALRVGAGLVTLATAISLQPVLATKLTEVTYMPLPEQRTGIIAAGADRIIQQQMNQYDVILIGCGLGQYQPTIGLVRSLLLRTGQELPPLVLDADALNILSAVPDWWQKMSAEAILTPHPGEMARMTGKTVDDVQSDRVGTARLTAAQWQKIVVLKGAFSVVARPGGYARISPFANAGLASAGTGDVLSGVIAGLVAQRLPLFEAAQCGVYLHATAGEMARARLGDAGMLASDLLPELPLAIKGLKEKPI
jgi:hydroxyethylthiazole kinase-like uncharacterized protein yjeF